MTAPFGDVYPNAFAIRLKAFSRLDMAVAKEKADVPFAAKRRPGNHRDTAMFQQVFAECDIAVFADETPRSYLGDRVPDIGKRVERAFREQASNTGNRIERICHEMVAFLECGHHGVMQDWSPVSAASAAACEIEAGLEVLWDWMFSMAVMICAGPPQ